MFLFVSFSVIRLRANRAVVRQFVQARLRSLPCHSLACQLGGGSVIRASTIALTLHQLSRLRAGILGGLCGLLRRCTIAIGDAARNVSTILACTPQGSLTRQLGGGSAIRESTIALTLHQLSASSAG